MENKQPNFWDYVGAIIMGAALGAMLAWGSRVIDFLG